uniref:Uncharacterized protein n=1 Tax=Rhizophora mucronata TaxID=61149 RepID=A0A2P2NY92_RHIMU
MVQSFNQMLDKQFSALHTLNKLTKSGPVLRICKAYKLRFTASNA